MPHYTYILYSKKLNRFYVGSTSNLKKRMLQHNNKESGYTTGGVPWTLIWRSKCDTREEAENLEQKIKNMTRKRKILFIRNYPDGIVY